MGQAASYFKKSTLLGRPAGGGLKRRRKRERERERCLQFGAVCWYRVLGRQAPTFVRAILVKGLGIAGGVS